MVNYKDQKRLPTPDTVARRKGKKIKPIVVRYKWTPEYFNWGWCVMGRYRTLEEAHTAIDNNERKYPGRMEYCINNGGDNHE